MSKLRFLDETLRNGQQSLWATRMRTEAMLPIAPVMDDAGFYQIGVMAGVSFESSAMYLHEDPWERMRRLRLLMPKTQLDVLVRARNLWSWQSQPYDVQQLFLRTLRKIGIDSVKIFDGLNDSRNLAGIIKDAKSLGFQVKAVLGYSVSPAHTDEYLTGKVRELVGLGIDSLILSDSAGIMTPDTARRLLPAVRQTLGELEMQFHAHTITGLANDCYREAMRAGVDVLWTAARPLAYGTSIPATGDILRMAHEEGRDTTLDEWRVCEIDDWFSWVAHEEHRSISDEVQFDSRFYERYLGHQIPGGMISNLVRQLQDLGMEHRLPEVLEEASRVRAELGYPQMVTPFSQFVGVQATLNIIDGSRYATVPEAVRLYARGYYGRPIAPLDPNVLDRLVGNAPVMDALAELNEPVLPSVRKKYGPFASDEDLLLFLFLNPAAYNDFRKNKTAIFGNARRSPLVELVKTLCTRRDFALMELEHHSLKLTLSGR